MDHKKFKDLKSNKNGEQTKLLSKMATNEFWDQDGHQSIGFFSELKKIFSK